MNRGEISARRVRHCDFRIPEIRNRKRRKERERQMRNRRAKLAAICSVPGVNRIERLKHWDARILQHANQVEPGIRNCARAIRESNQWQSRARRPDFRIIAAQGFKLGERENDVPDRARANQKPPMHGLRFLLVYSK